MLVLIKITNLFYKNIVTFYQNWLEGVTLFYVLLCKPEQVFWKLLNTILQKYLSLFCIVLVLKITFLKEALLDT